MEWLADTDADRWIREAKEAAPFGVIARLIPGGFEAYCRILHPIYEDPDIDDHALTWDQLDGSSALAEFPKVQQALARVLEESGGYAFLRTAAPTEPPARAGRLRWAEVAQSYGQRLTEESCFSDIMKKAGFESWPRYLVGPHEGDLGREQTTRLESILRRHTPAQVQVWYCWFPTLAVDIHQCVMRGHLGDLASAWNDEKIKASPEFWWPEDKTWCVCTDIDCTFTVVGGSAALIEAITADDDFETQMVTHSTAFQTS